MDVSLPPLPQKPARSVVATTTAYARVVGAPNGILPPLTASACDFGGCHTLNAHYDQMNGFRRSVPRPRLPDELPVTFPQHRGQLSPAAQVHRRRLIKRLGRQSEARKRERELRQLHREAMGTADHGRQQSTQVVSSTAAVEGRFPVIVRCSVAQQFVGKARGAAAFRLIAAEASRALPVELRNEVDVAALRGHAKGTWFVIFRAQPRSHPTASNRAAEHLIYEANTQQDVVFSDARRVETLTHAPAIQLQCPRDYATLRCDLHERCADTTEVTDDVHRRAAAATALLWAATAQRESTAAVRITEEALFSALATDGRDGLHAAASVADLSAYLGAKSNKTFDTHGAGAVLAEAKLLLEPDDEFNPRNALTQAALRTFTDNDHGDDDEEEDEEEEVEEEEACTEGSDRKTNVGTPAQAQALILSATDTQTLAALPTAEQRLAFMLERFNLSILESPTAKLTAQQRTMRFVYDTRDLSSLECGVCVYSRPLLFCETCGYLMCRRCHDAVHHPDTLRSGGVRRRSSTRLADTGHRLVRLTRLMRHKARARFETAMDQVRSEMAARVADEQLKREEAVRRRPDCRRDAGLPQHAPGSHEVVPDDGPPAAPPPEELSPTADTTESEAAQEPSVRSDSLKESVSRRPMGSDVQSAPAAASSTTGTTQLSVPNSSVRSAREPSASNSARCTRSLSRSLASPHSDGSTPDRSTPDGSAPEGSCSIPEGSIRGAAGSGAEQTLLRVQRIDPAPAPARALPTSDGLSPLDAEGSLATSPNVSEPSLSRTPSRLPSPTVAAAGVARSPGDVSRALGRLQKKVSGRGRRRTPAAAHDGWRCFIARGSPDLGTALMQAPSSAMAQWVASAVASCDGRLCIVLAVTQFSDPDIPPLPMAETTALAAAAAMEQVGYTVRVCTSRSQAHLQPTSGNIGALLHALSEASTRPDHSTVLFILSRGAVGVIPNCRELPAVLTQDAAARYPNVGTYLVPDTFGVGDSHGNAPTTFVDAAPLECFTDGRDARGFGLMLGRLGPSAQLTALYPKRSTGWLAYTAARGFAGRAVVGEADCLTLTSAALALYVSRKLTLHGCDVTAAPALIGSSPNPSPTHRRGSVAAAAGLSFALASYDTAVTRGALTAWKREESTERCRADLVLWASLAVIPGRPQSDSLPPYPLPVGPMQHDPQSWARQAVGVLSAVVARLQPDLLAPKKGKQQALVTKMQQHSLLVRSVHPYLSTVRLCFACGSSLVSDPAARSAALSIVRRIVVTANIPGVHVAPRLAQHYADLRISAAGTRAAKVRDAAVSALSDAEASGVRLVRVQAALHVAVSCSLRELRRLMKVSNDNVCSAAFDVVSVSRSHHAERTHLAQTRIAAWFHMLVTRRAFVALRTALKTEAEARAAIHQRWKVALHELEQQSRKSRVTLLQWAEHTTRRELEDLQRELALALHERAVWIFTKRELQARSELLLSEVITRWALDEARSRGSVFVAATLQSYLLRRHRRFIEQQEWGRFYVMAEWHQGFLALRNAVRELLPPQRLPDVPRLPAPSGFESASVPVVPPWVTRRARSELPAAEPIDVAGLVESPRVLSPPPDALRPSMARTARTLADFF